MDCNEAILKSGLLLACGSINHRRQEAVRECGSLLAMWPLQVEAGPTPLGGQIALCDVLLPLERF